MDVIVQGFKGEIPVLDVKTLPEMAASEAVNCDFKSGVLKSLPAYSSSLVSHSGSKLFFLSDSDVSQDFKTYLAGQNFYGVPAPVINDDRVVFVFNEGDGPKKATVKNIDVRKDGYYTAINQRRDLGLPKPSEPLEVEKEAVYTDYSASKVYYKGDLVHIHDQGEAYQSLIIQCISNSSVGHLLNDEGELDLENGVWNKDKSKSNWTWIDRHETVLDSLSDDEDGHYGLGKSHEKVWIFNESSIPCSKNTKQVISKDDLIQYTDGNLYRARFDYINRNRPDDPNVWNFVINMSEIADAISSGEYKVEMYDSDVSYKQGEMAIVESDLITSVDGSIKNVHVLVICNNSGTKGVHPLSGSKSWSIITAWDSEDKFDYSLSYVKSESGYFFEVEIEIDNTGKKTEILICLPYWTSFSASSSHPQWAFYRYIDNNGEDKWGLYNSIQGNSNIRPFSPEWGGENPWEIYKTKEDLEIDRSEIYDTVSYTYTWVSDWGEESEPADPTEVMNANMAEIIKIRIPDIDVPENIEKFRVYRLSGGMGSSEYLFFPNQDTEEGDFPVTHSDWIKDSNKYMSHIEYSKNLGEAIQTEGWDVPKDGLTGFVALANGCLAGFTGNSIYFSEPWIYYAYPAKYQITTHSKVVGLGVFNNTLVACTQAKPEVITCPLPGQASVVVSPHAKPCLSADSIVSAENYVMYAGHDGLVFISQDGIPKDMTRGFIDEDTWRQEFSPAQIAGAYYDGQYWGVIKGTSKGFLIPFSQPEYITMLDVSGAGISSFSGISVCPYTGKLYLLGEQESRTKILEFGGSGSDFLDWSWESKLFIMDHYVGHSAAKLDGTGDVTLTLKADGQEKYTYNFDGEEAIRLPSGRHKTIQFKLEGQGQSKVNFVKFSTQMYKI